MGYTMKVDGFEEYSEKLGQLGDSAPGVAAGALYEGAGVMADEISRAAETIQTAPFKWASRTRNETRLPSPEEKEIVMNAAAGIAKFKKSGTEVDTVVGFRNAGYAQLKGKTVPIPLIVNAINSGTSFMKKQPFFRKAANRATPKAVQVMKNAIETAWSKIYHEVMDKYGGR